MAGLNYGNSFRRPNKKLGESEGVSYAGCIGRWIVRIKLRHNTLSTIASFEKEEQAIWYYNKYKAKEKNQPLPSRIYLGKKIK